MLFFWLVLLQETKEITVFDTNTSTIFSLPKLHAHLASLFPSSDPTLTSQEISLLILLAGGLEGKLHSLPSKVSFASLWDVYKTFKTAHPSLRLLNPQRRGLEPRLDPQGFSAFMASLYGRNEIHGMDFTGSKDRLSRYVRTLHGVLGALQRGVGVSDFEGSGEGGDGASAGAVGIEWTDLKVDWRTVLEDVCGSRGFSNSSSTTPPFVPGICAALVRILFSI
jgi:hypothetical protein